MITAGFRWHSKYFNSNYKGCLYVHTDSPGTESSKHDGERAELVRERVGESRLRTVLVVVV